ncbi:hypothetical protein [Dinghuibacter silviterrae]|uniref:hypothetical protein n=1 Tax=Dinghuibacter silviterrae TaxID=1539049 RepID=UPI00106389F8|nr:hypothetical protein [Dinghuibacter silviterrae]
MSLEELGEILSREIFAGLKFGGKEESIHEEIPAIFIEPTILGLQIILDGYNEDDQDKTYYLSVRPLRMSDVKWGKFPVSDLLTSLIRHLLYEYKQIEILEE